MKRAASFILGSIAVLIAMGSGTMIAVAQNGLSGGYSPADITVEKEARALDQARQQAREAEARSAQLERDAATAANDADAARQQSAALALKIQASEADMESARAKLALIRAQQQQQADRLAARRAPLSRLLGALQLLSRRPPLSVFVQPGTLTDVVHVRIALNAVLPEINRRTASLRQDIERSRQLAVQAQQTITSQAAIRTELDGRRARLAEFEHQRRADSRSLANTAQLEADMALAMGDKARDIVELMGRIEQGAALGEELAVLPGPVPRPSGSMVEELSALLPTGSDGTAGRPSYRLPAVGPVVRGLGEIDESGAKSRGISIAVTSGAQIVAPASGRVAFAGPYRQFGYIVIIDHGRGWTTLITSMAAMQVRVGDSLSQGTPIGTAGPDRPRITVELRHKGIPQDIGAALR